MHRTALLGLLLLGCVGAGVELLLVGHTELPWQPIPLMLITLGLVSIIFVVVRPGRLSLRIFTAVMVAFVAGGTTGLVVHYRSNVEFELEMYPSLDGLPLIWEALTGAVPALAPGTMIYLGLIGLAYRYRHPALAEGPGQRQDN